MRIILILLLLIRCSAQRRMPYSCTKTERLVGVMYTSQNKIETFLSTSLHSMSVGQTNCHELMVLDGAKEVNSGLIAFISLVDSIQEYEFKSAYNFSQPTVKVECDCQCKTYRDVCYDRDFGYMESCTGRSSTGKRYWSEDQHNRGQCSTGFIMDLKSKDCDPFTAALCCQIMLYHNGFLSDYTAGFVTKPITVWQVEMGFADSKGELIGKLVKASLSSMVKEVTTTIGEIEIVDQVIAQSVLSPKWYFINHLIRELGTGVPINKLYERNLHKLGWYKQYADGQVMPLDWSEIRHSLSISVDQCLGNYISWKFNASHYYRDDVPPMLAEYVRVGDLIATSVEFDPSCNSVRVHAKNDASVLLHSKISQSAKLLFRYREVAIDKFAAEIRFNTERHILVLFFNAASGWFFASIECIDSHHEVWLVSIPSMSPIDTFKTLTLTCKYKCPTEVCIYRNKDQFKQCVNASCIKEMSNNDRPQHGAFLKDDATTAVLNVGLVLGIINVCLCFLLVN